MFIMLLLVAVVVSISIVVKRKRNMYVSIATCTLFCHHGEHMTPLYGPCAVIPHQWCTRYLARDVEGSDIPSPYASYVYMYPFMFMNNYRHFM